MHSIDHPLNIQQDLVNIQPGRGVLSPHFLGKRPRKPKQSQLWRDLVNARRTASDVLGDAMEDIESVFPDAILLREEGLVVRHNETSGVLLQFFQDNGKRVKAIFAGEMDPDQPLSHIPIPTPGQGLWWIASVHNRLPISGLAHTTQELPSGALALRGRFIEPSRRHISKEEHFTFSRR